MDVDRKCIQAALAGDASAMRTLVALLTPVVQARVVRALLRRRKIGAHDLRQDVADFA